MPCERRLPCRPAGLASGLVILAAFAMTILSGVAAPGATGLAQAAVSPVSIGITSITPAFATASIPVTVSGTVVNTTGNAMPGLAVQLYSSATALGSTAEMTSYLTTAGPSPLDNLVPGATTALAQPLAPHASWRWSVTLRASQVPLATFGVYPLAAQLTQGGVPADVARTFLPYWPGPARLKTLKPLNIAWLWPLIDAPHRAACAALLDNSLSASVASGGRLGQLLAAGLGPEGRPAHLTWVIDPALLADVKAMTGTYRVGGSPSCTGARVRPASAAARNWLAGVRTVAGQQDFFVTPYADVDVAALAHRGLDTELANAFADGQAQAQAILGQAQHTTPALPGGGGGTQLIAWPADGTADSGILASLAAYSNVGTVILDGAMMPPAASVSFTPTAVSSTSDYRGGRLNVLLSDPRLGHILALSPGAIPGTAPSLPSASAASAAAAALDREQWFLAETAMIAADAPHATRAVVVAPPRRWAPGTSLATALLADTMSAPWLRTASIASLAAQPQASNTGQRSSPPQHQVSPAELRYSLLRQVRRLSGQISLLRAIITPPGPRYLSTALDEVESSAWRGSAREQRQAGKLLRRVGAYVSAQEQQVRIVDTLRVTLGGKSGAVPVSISNRLGRAVRVRLGAEVPKGSQAHIGSFLSLVTVAAGTQRLIRIPVRAAAAGTTTLTLWLATPDGRVLPGSSTHLTVQATHFGTFAIVIIGIALAVFVLTAAGRALRHGGETGTGDPDSEDEPAEPDATRQEPPNPAAGHVTVEQSGADEPSVDERRSAKEPDEHPSTRGSARSGRH